MHLQNLVFKVGIICKLIFKNVKIPSKLLHLRNVRLSVKKLIKHICFYFHFKSIFIRSTAYTTDLNILLTIAESILESEIENTKELEVLIYFRRN